MINRPERARLYHTPPVWIEKDALFFITICCAIRGAPQLDNFKVFGEISNSVDNYVERSKWRAHLFLIMPDHLHALISFPEPAIMEKTIRDWKRYIAKQMQIAWQDGFFEHRLRSKQSTNEKWHYVLNNPVRKGLVSDSTQWPYIRFEGRADYP